MTRGQAERLFPLLEEALSEADADWQDLTAIGVGIGPGNFTGIRIGVSAARGLSLGLNIPAVGVSGFDARRRVDPDGRVAILAPRDFAYIAEPEPELRPLSELGTVRTDFAADALATAIAAIAAERYLSTQSPPAPLYLKPADAAPSSDAPPVMLD